MAEFSKGSANTLFLFSECVLRLIKSLGALIPGLFPFLLRPWVPP